MVMTTVFNKDGTLIQSRITLTELKVHIYPNAEFTEKWTLNSRMDPSIQLTNTPRPPLDL